MPLITNQKLYADLHYSTLFHEETLSFILTPPEHYSAYEKLFLPFDAATWVCFVIIFVYAFLSVFVINFISKGVQDVVYGTNVRTPYFNVIGTFFGVSQLKLPEANFPRILLMTFILYCLVLRTAYQSLLFEYVATDMRKSSPSTIEELHSNGYIVYALDIANDRLMSMLPENDRPNIKIISKREFKNILMNTENYENAKFALCELLHTFKLFLDLHPKTFVLLKQNLYTTMTGYITSKNHFLYELMNEIAQELVSAGLLQHAIEMSYSEDFMRTKLSIRQDLTERGSISFSDFAYGFTLWIFSCLVCFVVFLLELTRFYIKMDPVYQLRVIFGLFVLLKLIFNYNTN